MDKKILSVCIIALAVLAAVFAGCTGTQPSAATPAPTQATGTDSPTAAPTAAVVEKTVYIIGIDGEYPPYSYVDKDGNAQGFDVESAKWIAEDQGFEVKFQPTAWDGIIPALLAKKIDMVYSGMSITPERAAKVTFSDVYWIVNQGVAVKKGERAPDHAHVAFEDGEDAFEERLHVAFTGDDRADLLNDEELRIGEFIHDNIIYMFGCVLSRGKHHLLSCFASNLSKS